MPKPILLSSTKGGSGKSVIAIGVFLKLKENGFNPGYFKPVGDPLSMHPTLKTDKDVNVITAVVARKFSKEEICPVFLNPALFLDEYMPDEIGEITGRINDAYQSMAKKTDIILIEGNHTGFQFRLLGLDDAHWAKQFNANIIICAPIKYDDDLNDVIALYDYYKMQNLNVAGVILNGLNENAFARIEKYHKKILEQRGITFIGGLKESRQLMKPTVAEVMDAVGGRLIAGNYVKIKNNLVDGFIIGAMSAESALNYLRKSVNQCVITGGDRSDIALAALETSVSVIIFTGNMEPAQSVIAKADEKGVPLIVAPGDTFTTAEKLHGIHVQIQPNEIDICREQVEQYIDWNKIPKEK
jgi:BioD-like phosphotransacetylase family protein